MTDLEHIRAKTEMFAGSQQFLTKPTLVYNFDTKKIAQVTLRTSQYKLQLVKEILANIGDVILEQNLDQSPVEIRCCGPYISITNFGAPFNLVYVDKFKEWSHELCFCNVRAGTNVTESKLNFGAGRNGYGAKIVTFTAANAAIVLNTGSKTGYLKFVKGAHKSKVVDSRKPVSSQFAWELDPAFAEEPDYTTDEVALILRMCIDYTMRDRNSSPITLVCPTTTPNNFMEFLQAPTRVVASIPSLTPEDYMRMLIGENQTVRELGNLTVNQGTFRLTNRFLEFKVAHTFSRTMVSMPQAQAELARKDHPIIHGYITDNSDGIVHAVVNGIECNVGIHIKLLNDLLGSLFPELPKDMLRDNTSAFLLINGYEPKQSNQTKDDLGEINGMKSIPLKLEFPAAWCSKFEKWTVHKVALAELRAKNITRKVSEFSTQRDTKAISVRSRRMDTILLICEGVSARSYADKIRAMTFQGTSRVGVLPLQGKPENVTNIDKELKNKSILAIISEMGLDLNKKYTTEAEFSTLHYKKLYILTDPDPDGSHIKGLVMSIFLMYWPALLTRAEFLFWLKIPLVRITTGGKTYCYYSMSQVEKENLDYTAQSKLTVKYYKGLATSENKDILDDFRYAPNVYIQFSKLDLVVLRLLFSKEFAFFRKNIIVQSNYIQKNQLETILENTKHFQEKIQAPIQAPQDYLRDDLTKFVRNVIRRELELHTGPIAASAEVDLLSSFEKTKEDLTAMYNTLAKSYLDSTVEEETDDVLQVKWTGQEVFGQYVRSTNPELSKTYLTCGEVQHCTIYDYIVDEYSEFGNLSILRAIPDLSDGLKDVQRKIVFQAMYSNKIVTAQKVSTFSSSVAEALEYHHGSASMEAAVTHLMLDHQCTQHIPYLEGVGQYGSRSNIPGSARYIYVRRSAVVASLLIPDAEHVIPRKNIDGTICELEFIPFKLPMSVINGFRGIGTGWSSDVLPHEPKQVRSYILGLLDGKHPADLVPCWKNWPGEVRPYKNGWMLIGKATKFGNSVQVTCVPPSSLLYDKYIEKIQTKFGDQIVSTIRKTEDDMCDITFVFSGEVPVATSPYNLDLEYTFELVDVVSETNMNYYYHPDSKPVTFTNVGNYLDKFTADTLELYHHVMLYRKAQLEKQIKFYSDIVKYIQQNPDVRSMSDIEWQNYLEQNDILYENVKNLFERQKTKEYRAKIMVKIDNLRDQLRDLLHRTPRDMYKDDLLALTL